MQDIALYLPGILLAYSAFLLTIASPGPNILAIMGSSMSVDRQSGIALALGVATGSLLWAVLAVSGLSAVLSVYAEALLFIKIFGGLYLLWLAYKAFKSAASKHDIEAHQLAGGVRSRFGYMASGFLIQMTNPKAALAWVAISSLGMTYGAPAWVGASIVLGTLFMSITIHILYAIAFSTDAMVRLYSKARRTIQLTLGAFFTFAGLRLLLSRN